MIKSPLPTKVEVRWFPLIYNGNRTEWSSIRSVIIRVIRELKQYRQRPQRQLQKNNGFNNQNNSSARTSRFLVHFLDVHCTTTTWNLRIWRFMGGRGHTTTNFPSSFWTWIKSLRIQLQEKSPAFDILNGSTIKFERTQIYFLSTFSLPSSSSCLRSLTKSDDRKAGVR